MRAALRVALLGSILAGGFLVASPVQAMDQTGNVPLVVSPCHLNYRVHEDVDTSKRPPLNVSGTNAGVVCP